MSEIAIGTDDLRGSLKGHTRRWSVEVFDDGGTLSMSFTWFDPIGNKRVHHEVFNEPAGNAVTNLKEAIVRGIDYANKSNRRMIAEKQ
jgi:hypothetical protein